MGKGDLEKRGMWDWVKMEIGESYNPDIFYRINKSLNQRINQLTNPQSPSPPLGGRGVNESRINELTNHELTN